MAQRCCNKAAGLKAGLFDSPAGCCCFTCRSSCRRSVRLLDAVAGGFPSRAVRESLAEQGVFSSAVGVDISTDAVRIAAREHSGALWLAADLARLPLVERSTDVILNILSPINYGEFNRVLRDGGVVIKAVPGSGYLRELRQALYAGEERGQYSNEPVARLFEQRFDIIATEQVRQAFPVQDELWPHIVAMTPLPGCRRAKKCGGAGRAPQSVTLDFLVMVGRKGRGRS